MSLDESVVRNIRMKGGLLDFNDETREFTVIVTSEVVDSQGEIVDWESIQSVLPKIKERGYAVNYAHFGVYVGHSVDIWESDFSEVMDAYPETVSVLSRYNPQTRCLIGKNKIHKGAEIDDIAWAELKSGKINGVSFGGTFKELNKIKCDGVTCGKVITTDKAIFELALTGDGLGTNGVGIPSEKPANPTSIILALKSLSAKPVVKAEMDCPAPTQDLELNTRNRDRAIKKFNYGALNPDEPGDYFKEIAVFWNTTEEIAKKSLCANCVAFDISPRMKDCITGDTFDEHGELGYCWMHNFKCHSARTCHTWAKGGAIEKDEESYEWQKQSDPTTKSDPCWDGYEQQGMKRGKGGKLVPNCVPKAKTKSKKKNDPKTPAPKKDRIRGSKKNPRGSASGQRGGIKLTKEQIKSIQTIVDKHNEKVEKKNMADWKRMTMGQAKAVVRRGMGAFSVSHRPNVSSRTQWGLGRLNAFSKLLTSGKPKNAKYVGDNDLLPEEHKRSTKSTSKADDPVLTTTPNFLNPTYGGSRLSPQDEERRKKLEEEMAKLKSAFSELYLYDSLKSDMNEDYTQVNFNLNTQSNNTVKVKMQDTVTQDGNPPSRTDYQQAKTMEMMVALMERLNHLERMVSSSNEAQPDPEPVVEQQQAQVSEVEAEPEAEAKGYVEAQDISDVTDKENMVMEKVESKGYQQADGEEITTKMLYQKMLDLEKKMYSYKGDMEEHKSMHEDKEHKAYHDSESKAEDDMDMKAHHMEEKADDEEEETKAMEEEKSKADDEEEETKAYKDYRKAEVDIIVEDDEDEEDKEDEEVMKAKADDCGCSPVTTKSEKVEETLTQSQVETLLKKQKAEIFAEIGVKAETVKTPTTQVDGQMKTKSDEEDGLTLRDLVNKASQVREFAPDMNTLKDYLKN